MIGNIVAGLYDSGAPIEVGDFESIATVTVGSGGQATVEFTSIPGTYQHLQVRTLIRTARNSVGGNLRMRLNGNTGSNYAFHGLYGTGSSALATNTTSETALFTPQWGALGNTAGSGNFGVGIYDILDYTNTNKATTVRALTGRENNDTNGLVALTSGLFMLTNAITSISFFEAGNENISQYSHFALYGIKG